MNGARGGHEFWKYLASVLTGILVTAGSFFLLEGRKHVSAEEVRQFVNESSPYMRDKGTIFTRLDTIDQKVSEIRAILLKEPPR